MSLLHLDATLCFFGLENIISRRKQRAFQTKKASLSLSITSQVNDSMVSHFCGMQSKLIEKNIFLRNFFLCLCFHEITLFKF